MLLDGSLLRAADVRAARVHVAAQAVRLGPEYTG
jgi:hypothetical protein